MTEDAIAPDGDCEELRVVRQELAAVQRELVAARQELASAQQELVEVLASAAEKENLALRTALAWRTRAVGAWAGSAGVGSTGSAAELAQLRSQSADVITELAAMRNTVSWRITRPLRMVRGVTKKVGR